MQVAGQEVGLTAAQARAATTLAAVVYRDGRTQQELAGALGAVLDRTPADLDLPAARALLDRPAPAGDRLGLARALLGYGTARLSCRTGADDVAPEVEGPSGLTRRASRARSALLAVTGPLPTGGYAPGGVRSGHAPGSAHYEGRAVDVFFRPVTARSTREGWAAAQWLAAHADRLDLAVLIFDRRIWSTEHAGEGWRPYVPPQGPTDDPVLLHLDHVHLDVQRGSG